MVVLISRKWYVCDQCDEWFRPESYKKSAKCPKCEKGKLIKICRFCGRKFDECICLSKSDLFNGT